MSETAGFLLFGLVFALYIGLGAIGYFLLSRVPVEKAQDLPEPKPAPRRRKAPSARAKKKCT